MLSFYETISYYIPTASLDDKTLDGFFREFIKHYSEKHKKTAENFMKQYEKDADFIYQISLNENAMLSLLRTFATYFSKGRNSTSEIISYHNYPYMYFDYGVISFGGNDEKQGDLKSFQEFFMLDDSRNMERFMRVAVKKGVFDKYLYNYGSLSENGKADLRSVITDALEKNNVDVRNFTRVYEMAMDVNVVYCGNDAMEHMAVWNYNDSSTFQVERPTRFVYIKSLGKDGYRMSEVYFINTTSKQPVSYGVNLSKDEMTLYNMRIYKSLCDADSKATHGNFMTIQNEPSDYGKTLPRITVSVDDKSHTFLVGRTGNLYLERQPSILVGRMDIVEKADSDGKGIANVHLVDGYRALL